MNPWRAVLDTNVLISAYRFGGKPERVLDLALSNAFVPLLSVALDTELARVLKEKFLMDEQLIDELCTPYRDSAEWINPRIQTHLCPDEADNRVLECAMQGKADFVVTGDHHLLELLRVENFEILKPDIFLGLLQLHRSNFIR